MEIKSSAFKNKERIPIRYTKEDENVSPPLEWSGVPSDTKSFALVCEDPDAPKESGGDYPFTHWLIYNIPASTSVLPEGLPRESQIHLPTRASQGLNSFGKIGYGGPYPPVDSGEHHYIFTLYALDKELGLNGGIDKKALLKAVADCTLDMAQITGTYDRKANIRKATSSEREIRP